ncbi:hypothetical protein L838_3944 [Mycobacterium avium MAV_120709_2344]|nr:hypothetical protein L838_3944 [Mycobacterium avium MAV_120709_2344]
MPGGTHAGDSGAHDEDVKVFSHENHAINTVSKRSTPCRIYRRRVK